MTTEAAKENRAAAWFAGALTLVFGAAGFVIAAATLGTDYLLHGTPDERAARQRQEEHQARYDKAKAWMAEDRIARETARQALRDWYDRDPATRGECPPSGETAGRALGRLYYGAIVGGSRFVRGCRDGYARAKVRRAAGNPYWWRNRADEPRAEDQPAEPAPRQAAAPEATAPKVATTPITITVEPKAGQPEPEPQQAAPEEPAQTPKPATAKPASGPTRKAASKPTKLDPRQFFDWPPDYEQREPRAPAPAPSDDVVDAEIVEDLALPGAAPTGGALVVVAPPVPDAPSDPAKHEKALNDLRTAVDATLHGDASTERLVTPAPPRNILI